MSNVVVVGSINQDIVVAVPRLPEPGETVLGRDHTAVAGGKGANQAVAAARLGAEVVLIGRVGADAAGEHLCGLLAASGVDVDHVGVEPETATGHAFIFVDEEGENSIALSPGANQVLGPDHLPTELIAAADIVCVQLEIPLETVAAAVELAPRVVLNAAPAAPLPASLLAAVDVLVLNETEAATLTGSGPLSSAADAELAAAAITGPEAVVVTLGSRGAVLHEAGRSELHRAPRVAVVDTTGAGDAFCGALAARLAADDSLSDAVRWGVAAGTVIVTRRGAMPSLPTLEEVAQLL